MTAFFVRLFSYLRVTAVCDAIDPPSAEERIAAARRQTGERALRHGLGEIHKVKADNLAYFADHKPHGYAFTFRKGGE